MHAEIAQRHIQLSLARMSVAAMQPYHLSMQCILSLVSWQCMLVRNVPFNAIASINAMHCQHTLVNTPSVLPQRHHQASLNTDPILYVKFHGHII